MPGKSRLQQQREAAQARAVARGEVKRRDQYKHEFCRRAKDACFVGATNADLARLFRVTETTIDNWIRRKPLFARAVRLGRDRADERVARALYRRAVGVSQKAQKVFPNGGDPLVVEYIERYPPDTAAATFWLNNRRPDKWRKEWKAVDLTFDLAEIVRESLKPLPSKAGGGTEAREIVPVSVDMKRPPEPTRRSK